MGAVAGAGGLVASLGAPRRVYEVPKIQPPAPTRGDTLPVTGAANPAPTLNAAADPARVIAALKRAPGAGLHLVMPGGEPTVARPFSETAAETGRLVQQKR